MGVSVYVKGVRDPQENLDQMIELAQKCDELAMTYPPELIDYFNGSGALELTTATEMKAAAVETSLPGYTWDGDIEDGDGMTIDLSRLPKDIKQIRVYMD